MSENKNFELTRNELFKLYEIEFRYVLEEFRWKKYFSTEDICNIVSTIIERENGIIIDGSDLRSGYMDKINAFKFTPEEWQNYGIKDIINVIYDVIVELNK